MPKKRPCMKHAKLCQTTPARGRKTGKKLLSLIPQLLEFEICWCWLPTSEYLIVNAYGSFHASLRFLVTHWAADHLRARCRAFTAADTLEGMLWSEYCHQFASRHLRITLRFWWIHVSISQLCIDQWWSVFEGLPKCWNCGCYMFNIVRQAFPMHLHVLDLTSTYEAQSVMLWV